MSIKRSLVFVMFFMLSNISTAKATDQISLIAANDLAFEWVQSEALIFNTHQRELSQGKAYENMTPQELSVHSNLYCKFNQIIIDKISQIDIQGDAKIQKGFQQGLEHLQKYRCPAQNSVLTADQLSRGHIELLRALAYISVSRYETTKN